MKHSFSFDKLGMYASMICMAHVLFVPILFIFGIDSLLRALDNEWIERGLISISLIIGCISFLQGYISHKQHSVPILFLAGFLLLVNGESIKTAWLSIVLSVTGALIICYAHMQNLIWRRQVNTFKKFNINVSILETNHKDLQQSEAGIPVSFNNEKIN
ncbi:MAG: putative membrane protein [Roseivirga sp.]|jgi:predicted membrane protein